MSRNATRWAYSPNVNNSILTFCERAVLRALCYKTNPYKNEQTVYISDKELMRLTGYKSRPQIVAARKHLKELGVVMIDPKNKEVSAPSEYRYHVHFKQVGMASPDLPAKGAKTEKTDKKERKNVLYRN